MRTMKAASGGVGMCGWSAEWSVQHGTWEEIDKHAINTKKMMGHSQKQKQMHQGLPWLFQISHMALRTSRPQFSVY